MSNTAQLKGEEFVTKESAYGKNIKFTIALKKMIKDLFDKDKNLKKFDMGDIYFMVYIAEVL